MCIEVSIMININLYVFSIHCLHTIMLHIYSFISTNSFSNNKHKNILYLGWI